MQSLWLISQLLVCLVLGFVFAKQLPAPLTKICFKVLPYFSYILLIAIAFEFSELLTELPHPSDGITSPCPDSKYLYYNCFSHLYWGIWLLLSAI